MAHAFPQRVTRAAFKALLEEILGVATGGLEESDTRASVGKWSSLVDVEILTVIHSELGIDAEPFEYESVGELLDQLDKEQAFS